jgi:hypothetical protein
LGYFLGPALVSALFGPGFLPAGWLVAVAAAGVTIATACLVLNQIIIAAGAEPRLVGPWLLALGAGATAIAMLPGTPTARVAGGLLAGEIVALAGLLAVSVTLVPTPDAEPNPDEFTGPAAGTVVN